MKLVRSAAIISLCTLLSRVLGLVREIFAATFIGAGWVMDAFAIAFQVPNLFRRLFGEGALSAAVVPVFSEQLEKKDKRSAARFVNASITMLGLVLGILTIAGIGISFLLPLMAGDTPESQRWMDLFSRLLRIMLPYLPLICIVALVSAVLNVLKHFAMPALASTVLNICWIAGFVLAWKMTSDPEQAVIIIAWAIIVGGVLELLLQVPVLMAKGIKYRPVVDFKDEGVRSVLKLMGPTALGIAVVQINLLVDSVIAKVCVTGDGAVSALYFGNRLMQFPLALIGISLATAVFPYLAEHAARGKTAEFASELTRAFNLCLFVALPASVGLVLVAAPIVKLFFQWERFTASAGARTVSVLVCYSVGVWAYCCLHVVNRAFYALKDTATPVRVGAMMVGANVTLNLILVWPLGESGLALATAVTATANLLILMRILGRRVPEMRFVKVISSAGRTAIACIGMAFCCILWMMYVAPGFDTYFDRTLTKRIAAVVAPAAVGAASYIAFAVVLGTAEMKALIERLRRRKEPARDEGS
ncbi:MAG: murein biosynthesis integral membrane protein MurJ [Planctomycetota bacterium]|nr:murein biosynthesis integral membrane protein MurJ [Planctomycetota bacterium]